MTSGRGARVAGTLLVVGALGVMVAPERLVPARGGTVAAMPVATDAARPDDAGSGAGLPAPIVSPSNGAAATPGGSPDLHLVELRGAWRTAEDLGTASALALLAGAAQLATVDPTGPPPRLAVEAVEQPGPSAAVVTLLVAPDTDAGSGTGAGRTTRLAVPVTLGPDGVRLAGTPWTLPGPALTVVAPPGRPVTDADLLAAARDALDRAGLDGAVLTALEATDGWPFRTRLGDGVEGPWLRWHLDRFVVTGLPLHEAAGTGAGTRIP